MTFCVEKVDQEREKMLKVQRITCEVVFGWDIEHGKSPASDSGCRGGLNKHYGSGDLCRKAVSTGADTVRPVSACLLAGSENRFLTSNKRMKKGLETFRHLEPGSTFNLQSAGNWRQIVRDGSVSVRTDCAPCPVQKFKIVLQVKMDAFGRFLIRFAAKWH